MNPKTRETLRYFAEELVGIDLNPGQAELVDLIDTRGEELREIVVRKGRRIGMTLAASLVAGWYGTVLAPRLRKHVLPREIVRIALVATSRDQAALMLRFIKGFFEDSPMLAEQIASETSDTLTLVSGCEIVASVCSARAHRGWPNALVIIDEAAHYVESEGNMSLSSLLDALRPSQSQFGSLALMLAISTPLDASGAFYDLEQEAKSGAFPDTAVLHLPTIDARPSLKAEAERVRSRNPRLYEREYMGNYTSGDESFPLALFDACVDPDYSPPAADPNRLVVFGLDGAVSDDAFALVGIDEWRNIVYARAWYPPKQGTIDHTLVLSELVDLSRRFKIHMVAYDRSQIHLLAIEALQYGIPMREVSQAAGRAGGSMARHTTTLIETLTAHQLRFFPCPELRQHLANARFSTRSGGDRLVKATASKKIDLAIALTMAVGTLHDILREQAQNPPEEYEVISAHDYLLSQGREPAHLGWDQGFGEGYSPNYFLPGYWEDEW